MKKLSPNDRQAKEKGTKGKKPGKERKCYRCGATGHLAREDTIQKELIKSQKRKKKKKTMLLCWIRRVVMARVVLFILCVGGVQLKNVLIDSGATCNIVDRATWESLKQKGVKCKSRKCEKTLFAYGPTEPIEVVGTFESEIHCEESGEKCVDEFTVVEGRDKALLGKDTAKKMNVLRVGPPNSPQGYSITSEGTSVDIAKNFADVFFWSG